MSATDDPGEFARSVAAAVERDKQRLNVAARKISLEILQRIVMRSPVGNPELWAANAHAVRVNTAVADFNSRQRENASNLDARGRLKRNRKMQAVQGGRKVARLKLPAGQGYVGGMFRGSWRVGVNEIPVEVPLTVDPSGGNTVKKGAIAMGALVAGDVLWIVNLQPYAQRLEVGWSKQAPAGMVGVTMAEVGAIARQVYRLVFNSSPEGQ